MEIGYFALGIIGAYLLGSVSSAIVVCRLLRLPDPRTHGSGNPGTTNVLRIGGKFAAVLTLLGDVTKGALPVFLIQMLTHHPWIISVTLLAAVIGHLFPLYFHFKGGKGVATALGGIAALSPSLGGIFVFTWLGIFAITRYSSLSALVAFISMPFFSWQLLDMRYTVTLSLLVTLILWRHRSNIARLWKGKESQFKLK